MTTKYTEEEMIKLLSSIKARGCPVDPAFHVYMDRSLPNSWEPNMKKDLILSGRDVLVHSIASQRPLITTSCIVGPYHLLSPNTACESRGSQRGSLIGLMRASTWVGVFIRLSSDRITTLTHHY